MFMAFDPFPNLLGFNFMCLNSSTFTLVLSFLIRSEDKDLCVIDFSPPSLHVIQFTELHVYLNIYGIGDGLKSRAGELAQWVFMYKARHGKEHLQFQHWEEGTGVSQLLSVQPVQTNDVWISIYSVSENKVKNNRGRLLTWTSGFCTRTKTHTCHF